MIDQLSQLPSYLSSHLLLTLLSLSAGIIVCIPLGALVTRYRGLQWVVLSVAGVLQTIPGIAMLALMVPLLGMIGFVPALVALIVYSFLPILRNTVTGILSVEPAVIEAARGIGMTDWQVLRKVELPLSLPVIVAGIRTATVWVVGTATLATPVGATSLGNYIFSGLQTQNVNAVLIGCISAASLAIILDQLVHLVQIAITRRSRWLTFVATAILVVLFGAGIAPQSIATQNVTRKQTVVIGSKPFTEQYILSQLIDKIVSDAGYRADCRPGMGSMILFEALTNGTIDCYVDYSGTIWTNVLKREDIPPRRDLLKEMTRTLQSDYGVTCLGAIGFENTYALAIRRETAEKFRIYSLFNLVHFADEMEIGSDYEFFSRPEWTALQNTYDLNFKRQRTFDPSLMYSAINEKQVDVISAYSTDGRIAALDLVVLEDPQQALPPYDAVILLSHNTASDTTLVKSLVQLINSIDNEMMRRANMIVDVASGTVDSAAQFLYRSLDSVANGK